MSETLREASGMPNAFSLPPVIRTSHLASLIFGTVLCLTLRCRCLSFQFFSKGLNAPLPSAATNGCHRGGWGKPLVHLFCT
eukprot:CCRYP_006845-RA/>CCRYP_006845-RA protein AED:0.41 eAED:0.44 QI:0/0/0/1/0/0/2/0/80